MKNTVINDPVLLWIVLGIVVVLLLITAVVIRYVMGAKDQPMNKSANTPVDMELEFLKAVAELYVTMENRLLALAKISRGKTGVGKILIVIKNTTDDWMYSYQEIFANKIPEDFQVILTGVHNGVGTVTYPKEFQQHIRSARARGLIARK